VRIDVYAYVEWVEPLLSCRLLCCLPLVLLALMEACELAAFTPLALAHSSIRPPLRWLAYPSCIMTDTTNCHACKKIACTDTHLQ